MLRKQAAAAAALNVLLSVLSIGSWLRMALGYDGTGRLTSVSFASLKYFTVLSNLLCAVCALTAAALEIGILLGKRKEFPRWAVSFKLAGTVAVGLTFTVVIAFLGVIYGYGSMFSGSSLFLHLICPLLAWLVLIPLEARPDLPNRSALYALLPPFLYAIYYFSVILVHGREGNDFYAFCAWGAPAAVLIVLVIGALVYGMARLILFLRRRIAAGGKS